MTEPARGAPSTEPEERGWGTSGTWSMTSPMIQHLPAPTRQINYYMTSVTQILLMRKCAGTTRAMKCLLRAQLVPPVASHALGRGPTPREESDSAKLGCNSLTWLSAINVMYTINNVVQLYSLNPWLVFKCLFGGLGLGSIVKQPTFTVCHCIGIIAMPQANPGASAGALNVVDTPWLCREVCNIDTETFVAQMRDVEVLMVQNDLSYS